MIKGRRGELGAADWFSGIVLLDWGWVARSYTGFKRMWWLGMPSLIGGRSYEISWIFTVVTYIG